MKINFWMNNIRLRNIQTIWDSAIYTNRPDG